MNRRTALQFLLMGLAMPCVASSENALAPSLAYGASLEKLAMNMALLYDKDHPVTRKVLLPWTQEIRRRSQQQLDISTLFTGELCPDAEMYSAIMLDMASIGIFSPNTIVPPLPVSSLLDYPMLFSSSRVGSLVSWEMLQKQHALQRELHDVHVLSTWVSAPVYLHTIHKPVHSLEDIRGLNLIVWSPLNSGMIQQLGGTPIMVVPHDSKKLLSRNAVDGIVCPLPPLHSFGIASLLRYTTELPLNTISFIMVMNKDVWQALPPAAQELFNSTAGANIAEACGTQLDAESHSARQNMHNNGHTFVQPTQQARHDCNRLFNAMLAQEEQRLVGSGIQDAAGFTYMLQESRATHSRTTGEQW